MSFSIQFNELISPNSSYRTLYATLLWKISQTAQLQYCTITSSSTALKNPFTPKGWVFSVKLSSIAFLTPRSDCNWQQMHFYALKALHVFPTRNFHSHHENDNHISCIKLPQFLQQIFESKGFCFANPLYRTWDNWNANYPWFNLCLKKKGNHLQYAILPVYWDQSLSKSVSFFLLIFHFLQVPPYRSRGAELEPEHAWLSDCHCVHGITTTFLRHWQGRWSVQYILNSKILTFLMYVHSSTKQVP